MSLYMIDMGTSSSGDVISQVNSTDSLLDSILQLNEMVSPGQSISGRSVVRS